MMFANVPNAQATTYAVNANFSDGGIQGQTLFNGSFDWDGSTLSNFTGGLTQSMWAWQASSSTYLNRMTAGCGPMGNGNPCTLWDTDPNTPDGNAPVLNLAYQLGGITAPDANGDVLATVFLKNTTDVFNGGGYDTGDKYKFGGSLPAPDGNTPNMNAYFTLAFNALNPLNTLTAMSKIVYGDCTAMGLMGPMMTGNLCMTGHAGGGSMGGAPVALTIAAAEVPVPAAAWLFGGALMSLFGANRRKQVLPRS
jgi:hypothetical protein